MALILLTFVTGCKAEPPSVGPVPLKDVIRGVDAYGIGPGPKGIAIHIHAGQPDDVVTCTWPDAGHPALHIALPFVDAGSDRMAIAKRGMLLQLELLGGISGRGPRLSTWRASPDGGISKTDSIRALEPVLELSAACVEPDRAAKSAVLVQMGAATHVVFFRRETTGWRAVWDQALDGHF